MKETKLTISETKELLQKLILSNTACVFDQEKQTLSYIDEHKNRCKLTLPIIIPEATAQGVEDVLHCINNSILSYTIILIQAGAAAIGFYNNGVLDSHRVIKKYMVRKKQGTSQIKHLKSKGKSRLGSRIRLQNTVLFFEEINQTLQEYKVADKSETILLSLPINMINLLFTAEVPVPFDRKDPRIRKIPMDVNVPCFKELTHVNWNCSRATLNEKNEKEYSS